MGEAWGRTPSCSDGRHVRVDAAPRFRMRRTDPEIPCQVIGPLLRHVASHGADASELRRRHGLPDAAPTAPETMIALSSRARLFDDAAALVGDPFLGLHIGLGFERGHFGILEYSIASAPDLREAHRRLGVYGALLNPLARFRLVEDDEGAARVHHHVSGLPTGIGRHLHDMTLGVLLTTGRRLAGPAWTLDRVWFVHDRPDLSGFPGAPDPVAHLAGVFGTADIQFGAADNGVAFRATLLDLPVLTADPGLSSVMITQADGALIERSIETDIVSRVRPVVRSLLPRGGGLLVEVATRLRMSPRTLQRRLAEDSATLHEIVEEERKEEALRLLRDPRRPLAEIAYRLGYSDMANFLRAFKRWTGATPGQQRRRAASESQPS
jgi:AraC-like DNA-binding protein